MLVHRGQRSKHHSNDFSTKSKSAQSPNGLRSAALPANGSRAAAWGPLAHRGRYSQGSFEPLNDVVFPVPIGARLALQDRAASGVSNFKLHPASTAGRSAE